ncbi:hypothetical protein [Aureimonas sp. AU40]|uniref:hypothetical protein n=1 Tax=Aureimonas sp. AU40 TaxID=1637747 RepID=UPI000783FD96|nr:hypothetical protein [Aureimonas sp. AU40]
MPRVVTLVSGPFPHSFDYFDAFFDALADPDVVEVRQVENGHLRRIRRRDASAPGGWIVERLDEPEEDL